LRSSLVSSLAAQAHAAAESLFATFFPADCRPGNAPLLNISRSPGEADCLSAGDSMVDQLCSVRRERLPGRRAPLQTVRGSRPNCDSKPGRMRERPRLAPGLAPGLAERGRSAPQVGLSRQQPQQNVPGALTVVEPEAVAGREVLGVDHVFTSAAAVPGGPRIFGRAAAPRVSAATRAPTRNRDGTLLKPGRKLDARLNMAMAG
jgi:hypothetical protein